MPLIPTEKIPYIRRRYYDDEWSALEIAQDLGVGIKAVYNFMRRHGIKRRGYSERNNAIFLRKPSTFTISIHLNSEEERLRVIAIALYWSEGAKRGKIVDFANSDVMMCKIFMRFLREVCHINEKKLRGYVYCHEGNDTKRIIRFWSTALKIPKNQFTEPYVRVGIKKTKNVYPERMPNGVMHIRYGDLKLLNQIKEWIDELGKI